ncbi:MAG: PAS domain S-box protein, partial [bacterium]|nr:PAS domain S-box protein [bacterium]
MVFWKNLFFIGLSVLAAVLFSALTSIGIFSREFFGMVVMLFLLCHVARIISSLKTDRKNPVPGKSDSQKTISESSDSLWKSADRYRSLVNNMGEGVGVVDPDECFLYVNPMAEEFFGVPAEKMIGRSLKEFVDPKEYEIILTQMELRKKGKQSRYELKINRPEGGVRYLQVTASPEFDSKGNMVDVLGIFHDITWRKHKETELQVLQEINDAINSGTPLDDVLQIITLKIRELFNFKTCNVYLVEKDKQSLRYAALAIDSKILERIEQITGITVRNLTIPLFEGSLLKKIIDERKTSVLYDMEHVVSDFSDIKKLKVLAQEVTKIVGLKTGIRVPLIAGDDVFGVIGAGMNR